jgi:hypothetical protein
MAAKKPKSLSDNDIVSKRSVNRRALLGALGAGSVVTFSSLLGTAWAQGQNSASESRSGRTGTTDSDPNDPVGGGGTPRSGVTDADPNDTAGRGRGPSPRSGERRRER